MTSKTIIASVLITAAILTTTTAYAATTYFGEDCSIYSPETVPSKACYDLNYLNERVHDQANQIIDQAVQIAELADQNADQDVRLDVLEAIVNPEPEPVPVPTELTIELKPTSILAGENFTAYGEVPYVESIPLLDITVLDPSNSTIVYASNPLVNLDGSYTDLITTGGPTWTVSGNYTVAASYNGKNVLAILDYTIP